MVTTAYKPLPSWFNNLIARYQRSELPAKYSFWKWTKCAMSKRVIRHYFANRPFDVPWDQWCFWLEKGPANYYPEDIQPFAQQINALNEPFTFIDLGADVGVVALAISQNCNAAEKVIAVEPNPHSYQLLQRNMAAQPVPSQTLCLAVSDYSGSATLRFNPRALSDHGGNITPNESGETQVLTLDEITQGRMSPSSALAIKIDVEGQEAHVFKGGIRSIGEAKKVVLLLELHPKVLNRNAQTAEDLFQAAEAIRPFKWLVPAFGNQEVDRTTPFKQQFPAQQYDIIGVSR